VCSIILHLERNTAQPIDSSRMTFVSTTYRWSVRLNNRKPAKASKHARSPKI